MCEFRHNRTRGFPSEALSRYPRARRWRENGHKWCRRLAGAASLSHKCLQLLQEDRGVFSYTELFTVTSEIKDHSANLRQAVQRDRVAQPWEGRATHTR